MTAGARLSACCISLESLAFAHPPPLVGAGRGGGSRGPTRLSYGLLRACPVRTARPPSLILPHKAHKGAGNAVERSPRKLKCRRLYDAAAIFTCRRAPLGRPTAVLARVPPRTTDCAASIPCFASSDGAAA